MTTNSPNISEIELQNLYQLFPQFVTDGKFDYEAFKAYMNDEIETSKEPYKMTRHGKSEAKRRAKQPSILTLRPQKELSTDRDTTQNLFIEGDNGEVLKLLLSHYYNKVKMIYIDPPYNKDKDFVYSDTRKEPLEAYLRQTGQRDDDGATDTDIEKSGRKHSNWLNMMYPRLWTARKLLKDNGVIFVSIGSEEITNLIKLMDELYGEYNRVAIVARETKKGANRGTHFAPTIDYVLVYAKDINNLSKFYRPIQKKYIESFKYDDNDGRGAYKKVALYEPTLDYYKNCRYKIECPDGEVVITPKNKSFRCNKETFQSKLKSGEIVIERKKSKLITINGDSANRNVYTKLYLSDMLDKGRRPSDIILGKINAQGTKTLTSLGIKFSFSKPIELVSYLINITENSNELGTSNDIILDFFAGSGTTAHAVMDLNKEDGGNRKWICVQLPEVIDEKEEAYKAGYRTISELSRARIDKVIEKYTNDGVEGDLGYRALTLDKSNFNELNPMTVQAGETTEEDLNALIQQELAMTGTIPGRNDLDVIYELILRQGVSLHARIEQDTHGVYTVSDDTKTFYVNLQAPTPERIHARIQEHQENKACTLYMLEEKLSESQRINLDEYVTLITL